MKKYKDEEGNLRAANSDLIAPEEGREIIGGSQREDDYNTILKEIVDRDYPVVMGVVLLSSFLLLIGNIISDFLVAIVDPRIRFH